MYKQLLLPLLCLFTFVSYAQKVEGDRPIKIVEEKTGNRITLFAVNENDKAFDVKITITGSNIKQSKAKPRFMRVPGASKTNLKSLITMRNKKPTYKYDLVVNDSLSKRALRRPYERIEIKPRTVTPERAIILYVTENCAACDDIIAKLNEANYIYKSNNLSEKPKAKEQFGKMLATKGVSIDEMTNPLVLLNGSIYTNIDSYDKLLEYANKK